MATVFASACVDLLHRDYIGRLRRSKEFDNDQIYHNYSDLVHDDRFIQLVLRSAAFPVLMSEIESELIGFR
jgi:hypothetical protein